MLSTRSPQTSRQTFAPSSYLWLHRETQLHLADVLLKTDVNNNYSGVKSHIYRTNSHRGHWCELPSNDIAVPNAKNKNIRRHSESDFDRCSVHIVGEKSLVTASEMASNTEKSSEIQKLEMMHERIKDLHNMNILMPPKPVKQMKLKVKDDMSIGSIAGDGCGNGGAGSAAISQKRRCSIALCSLNDTVYSPVSEKIVSTGSPLDLDPKLMAVLGPHGTSALLSSSPIRRRSVDFAKTGNEDEFTALLRRISSNTLNLSPAEPPNTASYNKLFPSSKDSTSNLHGIRAGTPELSFNRSMDDDDEYDRGSPLPSIFESSTPPEERHLPSEAQHGVERKFQRPPRPTSLFSCSNSADGPPQKSKIHLRSKFSKTLSIKKEEEELDLLDDERIAFKGDLDNNYLIQNSFHPRSLSPIYQSSHSEPVMRVSVSPDKELNMNLHAKESVNPLPYINLKNSNRDEETSREVLIVDSLEVQASEKGHSCDVSTSAGVEPANSLPATEPSAVTTKTSLFDRVGDDTTLHSSQNFIPLEGDERRKKSGPNCEKNIESFDTDPNSINIELDKKGNSFNNCINDELKQKMKIKFQETNKDQFVKNVHDKNKVIYGDFASDEWSNQLATGTPNSSRGYELIGSNSFYLVTNILGTFLKEKCFTKNGSKQTVTTTNLKISNISPNNSTIQEDILNANKCHFLNKDYSLQPLRTKSVTIASCISKNELNSLISSSSNTFDIRDSAVSSSEMCRRRPSHNSIRTTLQYMRRQDILGLLLLLVAFLPFTLLALSLDVAMQIFSLLLKVNECKQYQSFGIALKLH